MVGIARSLWLVLRGTHRHPANIALHIAGITCYALGAASFLGGGFGIYDTVMFFVAGIGMFLAGHSIEGNLASITPVLIYRLVLRKLSRHLCAKGIHFLRA
jgi:hypothetical protein